MTYYAVINCEVITAQTIFYSFRVTFCCLARSLLIVLINFLRILHDSHLVHSAIHPFPLLQSSASLPETEEGLECSTKLVLTIIGIFSYSLVIFCRALEIKKMLGQLVSKSRDDGSHAIREIEGCRDMVVNVINELKNSWLRYHLLPPSFSVVKNALRLSISLCCC